LLDIITIAIRMSFKQNG